MYTEVFIKDFSELGRKLDSYLNDKEDVGCIGEALKLSFGNNPLFTINMQKTALRAITSLFLDEDALREWIKRYSELITEKEFEVMIVMAGNIPLVGFHDMLTVLACGRIAVVKLSRSDKFLIPALFEVLKEINLFWKERIKIIENPVDSPKMVIATGGDETAEYFRSRYPGVPSLTRGAKYSVAQIRGDEEDRFIDNLAKDIFLYYGMGCRSVSTLLIPENYDLVKLITGFSPFSYLADGEFYRDAYRYQKAVSAVSGDWFLDGGFFIFKKNCTYPPPLGVIGIVEYKDETDVGNFIATNIQSLQCMVNINFNNRVLPFGKTQFPTLSDYADGVNTLEFILKNS